MEVKLPGFLEDLDPNVYLGDNFVVLDFETTVVNKSPDPRDPRNNIVTATWCTGLYGKLKFVRGNEMEMGELVRDINKADFLVAHNTKFELGWLKRAGLDLYSVLCYCTQIGEYVYLSNRVKQGDLRLNNIVKRYFGEEKEHFIDICMRGGVCPSEMPASLIKARNISDVDMTRRLFIKQRERLRRTGLLPTAFTRNILTPALVAIEAKGEHLSSERVQDEFGKAIVGLQTAEQSLSAILKGYSPTSPKQMSEFVYDVLKFKPVKKGKGRNATELRNVAKDTLAQLKPTNKKQREFLELKNLHSGYNADVTKNLKFFKSVVDNREDNVFYFSFNQTVTATQRLSSSGWKQEGLEGSIQGQNIPRRFKYLFTARKEGWKKVEIDGAQLEFRVAGHLGRDVTAIQAIVDDFDVHTYTASIINGIEENEVTKALRTGAKADTFKPLYGGTKGTPEQMRYYEAFKLRYSGITGKQLDWTSMACRDKMLITETGLRFYYPNASMTSSGYCPAFQTICNYSVQSLATADIIPIAIVYIWHAMRHMEAFLTNTVHDSIVAESPDEELEELREIGKWAFLTKVYEYLKRVYNIEFVAPLGTGFTAGEGWSEGEELVDAVAPPYKLEGVDYSALEPTKG
ncbi:hypothetical protein NVP1139A_43 [Vibrio phage 1.139.A._10N.261.48.C6]|nr:hypothetical protein NVP1139A_43 [Vibrio phage 1.139.A._10N.261.48.C6]AUR90278.1 hypothetical protein NVP1139B_43 [Vibrio phage 1.139.B._10N.261.48.C6]AUR95599.1 hypothetical protein NVP1209O_42 [Vibrio phage 1.209.O._10N.222.52.B2]